MPNYVYPAIGLIGGTAGFLDAIDGTNLADKDMAYVTVGGKTYTYILDADSGLAESSPDIIQPDANGGDKRWILQSIYGNITFPATQVPSAGVNTLDDYEEGTWTPTVIFGGASVGITYGTRSGIYTKVGNIVHVVANIILTSKGSSTGIARVTDLPFTAAASFIVPAVVYMPNVSFANFSCGVLEAGEIWVTLLEITEAGVVSNIDNTDFADNSEVHFSLTYRVG